MDAFALRIVLSFFAGGAYVAFAILLAERLGPRLGGIAITAPSTAVFSLLFIGLSGTGKAAGAAVIVPAAAGATAIFIAAYAKLLRFGRLVAPLGALALWLVFAVPFAIIKLQYLPASVAVFMAALPVPLYALRSPRQTAVAKRDGGVAWHFAFRSAFAGSIIALSVYLASAAGPEWGGLLAGFPAAVFSSFILLSLQHGAGFAAAAARTMPLGLASVVLFAVMAHYAYPVLGVAVGTAIAYLASLAFVAAAYGKISR